MTKLTRRKAIGTLVGTAAASVLLPPCLGAEEPAARSLAEALQKLDPNVTSGEDRRRLQEALGKHLNERIKEANRRSSAEWHKIESLEEWKAFRGSKLRLLKESLGDLPKKNPKVEIHVTGKLAGDGYRIENLLYSSRTGMWVSANLYLPAEPREGMPGILLSHSHHAPKEQGELQDMGMTWARAGCAVLVPDHCGHGERRQHPFNSEADFAGKFPVSRQDYNFRYDMGMQLHVAGSSLMAQLAGDLMRGVSVLLDQKGVDREKIILLGAVAGGGDPAAVAAALDERIKCAVIFNFGGPQPETRYPLPDDAETWFNYAGGGSWESTRNITNSARDGFLPWVIVGSIAPRRLIHAHEFSWDRERDPVWKRLEKIWTWHGVRENLSFATGGGTIRVNNAEATHCTNIGAVHRKLIHEAFRKWFGIDVTPETEFRGRRDAKELACWTDEWRQKLQPKPLHEVLAAEVAARRRTYKTINRAENDGSKPLVNLGRPVNSDWFDRMLRGAQLAMDRVPGERVVQREMIAGGSMRKSLLTTEPGIEVPVMLLLPPGDKDAKRPVVVAVASKGKTDFLKNGAAEIAKLLAEGISVCLPDLRGSGEMSDDDSRGQQSSPTAYSSTAMMLGETLIDAQTRDLTSVVAWLGTHARIDAQRVALWGGSFTSPLAADAQFRYPRRIDERPTESDPLGPLLALVMGALSRQIAAVFAQGSLVTYQSLLSSPFVQLPHSCLIPDMNALMFDDLSNLPAKMVPRPLRLEGLVDGLNRLVPQAEAEAVYDDARRAYAVQKAEKSFAISSQRTSPADWLIEQLKPTSK